MGRRPTPRAPATRRRSSEARGPRPLRRGRLARRRRRPHRPPLDRHLLRRGLHPGGLGQQANRREGRGRAGNLGRRRRRRADDLGRPHLGPLPPHAQPRVGELPRLGEGAHGRRVAARRRHVGRRGRAFLRRRCRDREPLVRRRRRQVEHLARRGVRSRADRVLRRHRGRGSGSTAARSRRPRCRPTWRRRSGRRTPRHPRSGRVRGDRRDDELHLDLVVGLQRQRRGPRLHGLPQRRRDRDDHVDELHPHGALLRHELRPSRSRPSTRRGTRRRARFSRPRRPRATRALRRPASSRRTPSTRAQAAWSWTSPDTTTWGTSSALPGRSAASAGLSFGGTGDLVDLPSLGTFYDAGFTYEAWVKKRSAKQDVAVLGSWVGGEEGGPMIWSTTSPATTG